ncbi:MAG: hypothetical protein ACR2NU_06145 [Aeoliella sp.]
MRLLLAALFFVIAPIAALAQEAPWLARVTFTDGRTMEGQLDDATDTAHLWLRHEEERIVLATSHPWATINQVEIDGQPYDVEVMRANFQQFVAPWPEQFLFEAHEEDRPPGRHDGLRAPLRAASIAFEAALVNWDRDVEPDGYEIAVTVLDEYGRPMPVRGTLSATLAGERDEPNGKLVAYVQLERWSERVDLEDFSGGPAIYRLPFRRTRPEFDLDIAPGAILQVEVGAYGHGRFASSVAVPVRGFNAVRDRRQLQTGSRFFRGERSRP